MDTIYDCLVIGSGPSAEPVVYHLSQSKLSSLVIDARQTSLSKLSTRHYLQALFKSPKHGRKGLWNLYSHDKVLAASNWLFSSVDFLYTFAFTSGGLSNFWGGGAIPWSESEIELATSIPCTDVYASYNNLVSRLNIRSADQVGDCSINLPATMQSQKSLCFSRPLMFCTDLTRDVLNPSVNYDQEYVWNSWQTISRYINDSQNITYQECMATSLEYNDNIWHIKTDHPSQVLRARNIFLAAGSINSPALVATAYHSRFGINAFNIPFKHNLMHITPALGPRYHLSRNSPQHAEYHWDYLSAGKSPLASGYLFTANVLYQSILPKSVYSFLRRLIPFLLFRFYLITTFLPSSLSSSHLLVRLSDNKNVFLTIQNNLPRAKIRKIFANSLRLLNTAFKPFRVISSFSLNGTVGADIHYASSIPEELSSSTPKLFRCDMQGRISELSNIYICDPSRLSHLSSKPHTFTSMALTNIVMPEIISNISSKIHP